MIDEYYTFLIFGYHSDDLSYGSSKRVVAVCDECGMYRSLTMDKYSDICRNCINRYRSVSISKSQRAPKEPLPDGWQSKLSDLPINKMCPHYLGYIAEIILSNVYKDVKVMPINNHGYDFICNRGMKIDVKSAATGDKGYWLFAIRKNQIADYFLCIAFNNRDDLYNPVHLWLIPANKVNRFVGLTIRKNTVDKWSKYELPLNKVMSCCDSLR